ncbi:5-formyltetrahydrofolate cyclo-ligase [Jidongwangia harbinensis]|uniref:5-formyltetrahydrofolate cyclo-ligase n=1 Tax=Jidongwangia harbinensis TaxID=2878561 RepID=UPI001CD92EED|nr:5-formyltetrahydrofolate cyclo-ligase [Jidongwangia harbinensis]MCA2213817.1 5-formyltetrahydrofolate cyclo-ligase [Jidongwangia harbinensis]
MPDLTRDAEISTAAKIALRNRVLTARRTSSPADRAAAATAVQTFTIAAVRRTQPTRCAAYVPVGSEPGGPDLPDALASALPPGGELLLPVLRPDGDLDWARYDGALTPGRLGLREPAGPRLGVDAIRGADLIIVPALAVSRTGIRLGRGGGSYDRALDRAGATLTLALLHDGELVEHVPAEPHDRPVHGVITPTDGPVMLRAAPGWTK